MKKLILLIVLFTAVGAQAAEKAPAKTADSYREMLDKYSYTIFNWYSLSNGRSNSVVDKAGNVLSIDFFNDSDKAHLQIDKNSCTLTVEGEDSDGTSHAVYTFDNLQRLVSADCDLATNRDFQNGRLNYLYIASYNGESDFSTKDTYLFRSGYSHTVQFMPLNSMFGVAPAEFGKNEGAVLTFDPVLKECTGIEYLGADGKPKSTESGYSSFRISYTKCPKGTGSSGYYGADEAVQQLYPTGLQALANDPKYNYYYLSKVEFFDPKGKLTNTSNGLAQVVCDIQFGADEELRSLNLQYLDCDGRPVDYKQDDCLFSRIEYIKNDTLSQASLYTADGSLTNGPTGSARYCNTDSEGNETRFWLDKEGRYVLQGSEDGRGYGYYSKRSYVDGQGRYVSHTAIRGTSPEDRVTNSEGYSDEYIYYNNEDHDQTLGECYFGADGKPAINTDKGYASRTYKYNDNGDVVEECYFGADGKLIEIDGIARRVYGYRNSEYNYSPDFTWCYNAANEMITPENMPKNPVRQDNAEWDEEPVVRVVE